MSVFEKSGAIPLVEHIPVLVSIFLVLLCSRSENRAESKRDKVYLASRQAPSLACDIRSRPCQQPVLRPALAQRPGVERSCGG